MNNILLANAEVSRDHNSTPSIGKAANGERGSTANNEFSRALEQASQSDSEASSTVATAERKGVDASPSSPNSVPSSSIADSDQVGTNQSADELQGEQASDGGVDDSADVDRVLAQLNMASELLSGDEVSQGGDSLPPYSDAASGSASLKSDSNATAAETDAIAALMQASGLSKQALLALSPAEVQQLIDSQATPKVLDANIQHTASQQIDANELVTQLSAQSASEQRQIVDQERANKSAIANQVVDINSALNTQQLNSSNISAQISAAQISAVSTEPASSGAGLAELASVREVLGSQTNTPLPTGLVNVVDGVAQSEAAFEAEKELAAAQRAAVAGERTDGVISATAPIKGEMALSQLAALVSTELNTDANKRYLQAEKPAQTETNLQSTGLLGKESLLIAAAQLKGAELVITPGNITAGSAAEVTERGLMQEARLSVLDAGGALLDTKPAAGTLQNPAYSDLLQSSINSLNRSEQLQLSLKQAGEPAPTMQQLIQRFAPVMQQQLIAMVSKGIQHAEIRLDPPELGQLIVRIQVQGDQTQVQFHAAQSQTRDVLEQAMPRLKELLAEQGLQLTDSQVSQQQGGREQGEESEAGAEHGDRLTNVDAEADEITAEKLHLSSSQATSYRTGIDYYA